MQAILKPEVLLLTMAWNLKRTKSSQFFLEILEKYYTVSIINPENEDLDCTKINKKNYFAIFFFQYPPFKYTEKLTCKNIIFIPMYDTTSIKSPEYYHQIKKLRIIDFSKKLHDKHIKHGIQSYYLKYYPKPDQDAYEQQKNSIFFWQRTNFTWENLKVCLGSSLENSECTSIFLHSATDPNFTFLKPSDYDIEKYAISISKWFDSPNDLNALLDKSKYYIAPRQKEGIGLSFLNAMAKGCVIIAHNDGTMNEYIQNNINGYLINFNKPSIISFSDYKQKQKLSFNSVIEGRKNFENSIPELIDFIAKDRKSVV